MPTASHVSGARERLLETASYLFYKQGYLATGINQLIEEAGIARASFYQHFASKEDLCATYLADSHQHRMASLEGYLSSYEDPRDRLLGLFDFLKVWKEQSGYRGCAFLNIVAEIPSTESLLRAQALRHYDVLRSAVARLTQTFAAAYRPALSPAETTQLGESLVLLFEGALVSSQNYAASWPVDVARAAAVQLLDG